MSNKFITQSAVSRKAKNRPVFFPLPLLDAAAAMLKGTIMDCISGFRWLLFMLHHSYCSMMLIVAFVKDADNIKESIGNKTNMRRSTECGFSGTVGWSWQQQQQKHIIYILKLKHLPFFKQHLLILHINVELHITLFF
jgi:hypothetical protein